MRLRRTALVCLVLGACTSSEAPAAKTDAPTLASASSPFVAITKPQDRSILDAPAVVRASSPASGEVTAPTPLRIARVHVQVGDPVSVGDPIVDAYSPEVLDAAASYLSSASRARIHDQRADQLEALRGEGLVGRSQVFQERATAADLRASRLSAVALLRSSGVDPQDAASLLERGFVTLSAPVNGIVTELSARVGRSYDRGASPIATIRGEAPARIEIRTTGEWPRAESIEFVAGDGRTIGLDPVPIAAVVVPSDGTKRSWFTPAEPIDLPDGLMGTVRLKVAEDVWEVPATAILQRGGQSTLVRRRGEISETITVEVVSASGASALVRGPLAVGDLVASSRRSDAEVAEQP
jgi:multidrug efflux pump subunit AcrA (membrane-fusion protein)